MLVEVAAMRTLILLASILLIATTGAQEWRQKFNEVYRLEEGQCLKRIAPPFIAERMQYYREHVPDRTDQKAPDYISFHWNGKLEQWGEGWGSGQLSLRGILDFVLQMQSFDYQLSPEIEKIKLDGDWIVDPNAETSAKLAVLCAIIKNAGGPGIRFVQKELSRNVIVASGEFVSHPLENIHHPNWIHLYVGTPDKDEGAGGGSGDLKEFLQMLGSRIDMPIDDQIGGDRPTKLQWGHHSSTNHRQLAGLPEGKERDEKIDELLKLVTQQTEVQFKKELRMVSVWVAERAV
jgi:hypothetical protein